MESKKNIAIVGAGPAGCTGAYFAQTKYNVFIFDFKTPLLTLLPTGGGRCNLAYAEYDFKELVKFYPRGEKFLYSVFSKFSTSDTIVFFKKIGVQTYVQDDLRIFPASNSSKNVREKMLNSLRKCNFKKEKVLELNQYNEKFKLTTDKDEYIFDKIILATGGHANYGIAKAFGHTIVKTKPALTGLITNKNFKQIQGVSLKNIKAEISFENKKFQPIQDDLLFTHEGISGPLAYKISSICAREDYSKQKPLSIKLNLLDNKEFTSKLFQEFLNDNSKKDIKNLLADFIPKSVVEYILNEMNINFDIKCSNINGKTRDLILNKLKEFEINVISAAKDGEVVTSGGISLDEINPSTMESKLVKGLYFCGEIIDVDGFCGGFNLQNCWSTGYIAGINI